MNISRVKFGVETTKRLQMLKSRTGLTPNILCRIALCYSLNDPRVPSKPINDGAGQEIARHTLFGEYDYLYMALIKERCITDCLDPDNELADYLDSHLERGIIGVFSRVKHISDIRNLAPNTEEIK